MGRRGGPALTGGDVDPRAFDTFEREGWERAAGGYELLVGLMARRLIPDVLAAAAVGPGDDLLDIGCGPGHLAGAAAAAGVAVVGLDVAEAMLALVRRDHPAVEVRGGSADDLPFPDARFDAAVANLVILHLGRPEAAVAEAARVLRPGGRLVLTTWDQPQRCRLLGVMLEALATGGANAPSAIPRGPAFFRFADESAFANLVMAAGFGEVDVRTLGFDQNVSSAAALWEGLAEGSVRTSAVLRAQSPETQDRVRAALDEALAPYAGPEGFVLPVSFRLAVGRRA